MKEITTQELKQMRSEGQDFVLINTLDPEHFQETHIPDSVNVPQSEPGFADRVLELIGTKDRQVVVYCASRECDSSEQAADKLEQAGFNVVDYAGGAAEWQQAGERLGV